MVENISSFCLLSKKELIAHEIHIKIPPTFTKVFRNQETHNLSVNIERLRLRKTLVYRYITTLLKKKKLKKTF